MKNTKLVSMDKAGRLIIPKAIREKAGIQPNIPLEISVAEGKIEIVPAPREIRIVQDAGIYVAVPLEPVEPLTVGQVEAVRRQLREERRKGH